MLLLCRQCLVGLPRLVNSTNKNSNHCLVHIVVGSIRPAVAITSLRYLLTQHPFAPSSYSTYQTWKRTPRQNYMLQALSPRLNPKSSTQSGGSFKSSPTALNLRPFIIQPKSSTLEPKSVHLTPKPSMR